MKYASPWKRLFAFIIDIFAIIGLYMALGMVCSISLFCSLFSLLHMIGFWFYGSLFFLNWMYFAIFESSSLQATLGKHLLGLKVVDLKGQRVSFWRASAR